MSFRSQRPGAVLYRRLTPTAARDTSARLFTGDYERICAAPCETSVPFGRHLFAFALADGGAHRVRSLDVDDDGVLSIADRGAGETRMAGWVLFSVGTGGTAISGTAAALMADQSELAGAGGGVLLGAGLMLIGLVLAAQRDGLTLHFD